MQKASERAARAETGTLAGIPTGLPALTRAAKLTRRAGRVGFDWPDAAAVLDKLEEEADELRAELQKPPEAIDNAAMKDEVGDLLFVLANLARKLDLDPEDCLRGANRKFERRFRFIEQALVHEGKFTGRFHALSAWRRCGRKPSVANAVGLKFDANIVHHLSDFCVFSRHVTRCPAAPDPAGCRRRGPHRRRAPR